MGTLYRMAGILWRQSNLPSHPLLCPKEARGYSTPSGSVASCPTLLPQELQITWRVRQGRTVSPYPLEGEAETDEESSWEGQVARCCGWNPPSNQPRKFRWGFCRSFGLMGTWGVSWPGTLVAVTAQGQDPGTFSCYYSLRTPEAHSLASMCFSSGFRAQGVGVRKAVKRGPSGLERWRTPQIKGACS